MPLPGGATDKLGNRYEGRWTVNCIADVLDERAISIRLEPPGAEGEGVEFYLLRNDIREYHQVKRQHSASGHWTLAELEGVGVLSHFWQKLREPQTSCVFVSTLAAFQIKALADRARDAASWEEYNREFLKADQQSTNFNKLRSYWGNCAQVETYETLKRVHVRTVDEDSLRTNVESRLAILVDGDPATISDILVQLALDNVHQELTAHDLWHHLQSRGYHRCQWGKDPHVLATVVEATDRYLRPLRSLAIDGTSIPREEAQTVFHILTSLDSKRGVLLAGTAGAGKSGVIVQVIDALREQGVPVIAFRVDRLEPTQLPDHVGQQIGLRGSPANVLAAIANGRDCVLVIDQLDAVSLASGRHPQFFDCVDAIIKQAQAHPRMRILFACRKFDLDNDQRLRELARQESGVETVMVNQLSHITVKEIVVKLGLNAERLNNKQLDLLSIPLHLSLLAEIATDSKLDLLDFKTAKELYDRFWNHKQEAIRARLDRSVKWTQVVDALCDYMSNRQALSAPENIVAECSDDAKEMASEHVLIRDSHGYSFFHESFFDYAYARRFVARGLELLPLLRSGEQHLFRRAQVRQILLHLRDMDRSRYLVDLNELITCEDIRFHLKKVVFSLLAELPDPTEEEWNIVASFASGQSDSYGQEVWRILHHSVSWFQLLDSLGLIEKWLADQNEEHVNRVVRLLASMQRQLPDRIAELLEPYCGKSEVWRDRLISIMRLAKLDAGRRFFDLFLRLIDEANLAEERRTVTLSNDFWHTSFMGKKHQEWTCEAIGHYLNRCLTFSCIAGQYNPFDGDRATIPNSQLADTILNECAQAAPGAFVLNVLPFMLLVMKLTAERDGEPPWPDPVWRYRHYGESYGIDDALLRAMENALSNLAKNEPETLVALVTPLRTQDFETVQFLLIRAFAANGNRFADEAADYLCERPVRLKTGYFSDYYYATRQLLEAITPHCSDSHLARLEELILNYYPTWERSADGRRERGYAQFVLLEGIAPSRRSTFVIRRLQEWRRKFGEIDVKEPKSIEVISVPSPISENAADKMNDKQWLKAIARYHRNENMRYRRGDHYVGGAIELSRVLEAQVRKEPTRFAKLINHFPDSAHLAYFEAVLRGITDVGLDVQTVLQVCQRCHQLPNRPCGRYICEPISKLAKLPLPNDALDLVAWYATQDANPKEETWRTKVPGGKYYRENGHGLGHEILTQSINSVRGVAAEAIAELIFYDSNRVTHFLPTLKMMVDDPSIAVRSCVAATLIAVLRHDRDLAVNLFQKLCATEEILLATHHVERLLLYALQTHFDALLPILKQMINSDQQEVAMTGARQACLAALDNELVRPLAQLCLSGTDAQRLGVAQVFASNLKQARFRSFCEEALKQLFNDPNEKVRTETEKCFGGIANAELKEFVGLIEAFVHSKAFPANHFYLMHALENTVAKLPDITCLVCERFLDVVGLEAADTRTHSAVEAHTLSQLLLRIYSQSKNAAIQTRCLDLIDRMIQMEIYGLKEALETFDR